MKKTIKDYNSEDLTATQIKALCKDALREALFPIYQRSTVDEVKVALLNYVNVIKESNRELYAFIIPDVEENGLKVELQYEREKFFTLCIKFWPDGVINYSHLRNQLYSPQFYL